MSIQLTTEIYKVTAALPDTEKFGLTSQIRRSIVSVASNIAEGGSRSSVKDFSRFLEIALGSCFELNTQLNIAKSLNYIDEHMFSGLIASLDSISKQISGLRKSLK